MKIITVTTLTEPGSTVTSTTQIISCRQGDVFFLAHNDASDVPVIAAVSETDNTTSEQDVYLIAVGGNASNAIPANNSEKQMGVVTFSSGRQFYVFV